MDLAAFIKQERDIITAFEDWWCEGHNAERKQVEKYGRGAGFPLRMTDRAWRSHFEAFRETVWPTL